MMTFFHRDITIDTDVEFTLNGKRYFTEDFPVFQNVEYDNKRWLFDLGGLQPLFIEENGIREVAGTIEMFIYNQTPYEGGKKRTFSGKSFSTGDGPFGVFISLILKDDVNGDPWTEFVYYPDYIVVGGDENYRIQGQASGEIPGRRLIYQSASASVEFGEITDGEINASFSAFLIEYLQGPDDGDELLSANIEGSLRLRSA